MAAQGVRTKAISPIKYDPRNTFYIGFTENPNKPKGGKERRKLGLIGINNFSEYFEARIGFWSESEYIRHWKRTLQVFLRSSTRKACLITDMPHPKKTDQAICWLLMKKGDQAIIHNQSISFDKIDQKKFDAERPWQSLLNRGYAGNEPKLFEWTVHIESIRHFLLNLEA